MFKRLFSSIYILTCFLVVGKFKLSWRVNVQRALQTRNRLVQDISTEGRSGWMKFVMLVRQRSKKTADEISKCVGQELH